MVSTAKRYGEFVADFAAQCALLGELKMVCIRRAAPAGQTGLSAHELKMIPVAQPKRFAQRGDGLSSGFRPLRRRLIHFRS
jgi:hypothetical protein